MHIFCSKSFNCKHNATQKPLRSSPGCGRDVTEKWRTTDSNKTLQYYHRQCTERLDHTAADQMCAPVKAPLRMSTFLIRSYL